MPEETHHQRAGLSGSMLLPASIRMTPLMKKMDHSWSPTLWCHNCGHRDTTITSKGIRDSLCLEPNISDHGPGTQIQITLKQKPTITTKGSKGIRDSLYLEPNMSDHDIGTQIQVTLKSVVQCGSSFIFF